MPLRGTMLKQVPMYAVGQRHGKKSLDQEVAALKRQVALNTPSPYYFRTTSTFLSSGAGIIKVDGYDVTNNFVTSGTYHDNVTGDKYINNHLHLNLTLLRGVYQFRMIVYVPKNPDVTYTPAASQAGMVSHPDPNSFWILKDVFINEPANDVEVQKQYWVSLRKLQTIYNTDLNIVEKGRVRICFIFNTTAASSADAFYLGTRLSITDK